MSSTKTGNVTGFKTHKRKAPISGVKRYILTSAQANTEVYENCWYNLLALADHYDAEVLVSRYTYSKAAHGGRSVKPGTKKESDLERVWWANEIKPYVSDQRIQLAPGLVWCGELNILPTAVDPISGLEAYTGRQSCIIPHAKFAMTSVAATKLEAVKLIYTTGTVTLRNYIQKKEGLKAETFHGYGGLLVEVCPDGSWFVRQLEAGAGGTIQDLDVLAALGECTVGHQVEAINWGDIHAGGLDPKVAQLGWKGKNNMLDTLKPKYQFAHDVLNFGPRNHHEMKNSFSMYDRYVNCDDNVELEISDTFDVLAEMARPWCTTLVVDSNHDRAFDRWLTEADYRADPVNALFFLEASLAKYTAIRDRTAGFHLYEWALKRAAGKRQLPARVLKEDESFVVCRRGSSGGIECGLHGDRGPNGKFGSLKNFARMGRKTNTGHAHWAGIFHGSYQSGTSSKLDMGYNKGPSSWSHSHIVTYPDGTRTIITFWKGRWKA